MIDVRWFDRVASFARPDLSGCDREKLCKELGELYEVLPFVVTAGGFADWPLTRAAMKAAARGLTRASQMRPAEAGTLPPDLGRPHMREQVGRLLDARAVKRPSEFDIGSDPKAEEVAALVRAARSSPHSRGEDPGLYILAE